MRRATLVGIALVLVAALGTFLLRRQPVTTADAGPSHVEVLPSADSPPPSSTPATRPSPADVAIEAVCMSGGIATAGFITRADLIGQIATVRFAPTLSKRSAAQLTEMAVEVGNAGVEASDLVWQELPLTADVVEESQSEATVRVWSVLIVGVPGHGAPRQVWRTITVTLLFEAGRWLVDDWDATAGPTPALASNAPISDLPSVVEVLAWSDTDGGDR